MRHSGLNTQDVLSPASLIQNSAAGMSGAFRLGFMVSKGRLRPVSGTVFGKWFKIAGSGKIYPRCTVYGSIQEADYVRRMQCTK